MIFHKSDVCSITWFISYALPVVSVNAAGEFESCDQESGIKIEKMFMQINAFIFYFTAWFTYDATLIALQYKSQGIHKKPHFKSHESLAANHVNPYAYINDAFAFLQTQDYSAYKHYDGSITSDILDGGAKTSVNPSASNGAHQNMNNNSKSKSVYTISGPDSNGYSSHGNGITSHPSEFARKDSVDDQSHTCCNKRCALISILVILIIVVLGVAAVVAVFIFGE